MSARPDPPTLLEIVGRAGEVPPEERAAFLDEACGGDAALRAEAGALVDRLDDSEALFDRLEGEALALREAIESTPPAERIGPYEIVEELGRGGMGVVWKARDARLGRMVALKLLPPWTRSDPDAVRRLVEEARAASAIDHPAIAAVHDVVEAPDGSIALVLAHYEGETLADRLDRGPLSVEEAVDLGRRVAAGLDAAHRHGVVHRDVKPSNLLLGADGRVRILDFGIARPAGESGRGAGTAAYMAPERIEGGPADARVDLWALGVVLYEAVAGRRPFEGEDEEAVLRAVVATEPEPPAGAGPLEAVIERLLAKRPEDRYPDAAALMRDLDALARPGRGPAEAGRSRRARLVGAAAAAAVVVAGGLLVRGVDRPAAVPDGPAEAVAGGVERVAILPFRVRGSASLDYLDEGIVDLLSTSLDGVGEMRAIDPRVVLGRTGPDGTPVDPAEAGALAAGLGARRFVLGDAIEVDGRVRIRADLYEVGRAEPLARASVEGTVDRLFNLVDELTAQLLVSDLEGPGGQFARLAAVTTTSLPALKSYLDGERAMRRGRFGDAVEAFQAAVEADSTFALAHYRLSKAASWDRRYGIADASAARAVRYADRLAPTARAVLDAWWANWQGDRLGAERLYRRVIATAPDHVEAWNELGELLFHYNQVAGRSRLEARGPFERALALDPDQGEPLYHLLELTAWVGDAAAVDSLYRRLGASEAVTLEWRALRAFTIGDAAARRAVVEEGRDTPETDLYRAVETVSIVAPTDPEAWRLAGLLVEPGRTPDWRSVGHWARAHLAMAGGEWEAAAREMEEARALTPAWGLEHRALYASLPFVPVEREVLEGIRDDLEAWDASSVPPSVSRLMAIHDGIHVPIRLYLLGLVESRLGFADSARARAVELESLRVEGLPWLAPTLAAAVRARVAWRAGRMEEAWALVGDRIPPIRADMTRSPILAGYHERWLRAEILEALGRDREAAAWRRAASEQAMYGLPYRAAGR